MESIKCQIGETLRNLLALLILTASSALWAAGSAIITLEMPVGARQLGMGEVGAAIADDATALYYNPAGLAFGPLADEWRMSYPEKSEKSPFFTKIAARTRPGFFAKSELWAGTNNGIMRFDGERWLNFHSVLLEGNMKIRDVVRVFVGTERGLDEFTRQVKKFNNINTPEDEAHVVEVRLPWNLVIQDTVTALLYESRTEKLWVGTSKDYSDLMAKDGRPLIPNLATSILQPLLIKELLYG